MPQGAVDVVGRLFGVVGLKAGDEIDLAALFSDPDAMRQAAPLVSDDAAIEFATPDGGDGFGPMGGPFVGITGLRAGWAEWLGAWESFRGRIGDVIEVGPERVLVLAHALGRMRGSGFELDAPSAMLFTVRDGVIVRIEHFLDQEQARRAAGLDRDSTKVE